MSKQFVIKQKAKVNAIKLSKNIEVLDSLIGMVIAEEKNSAELLQELNNGRIVLKDIQKLLNTI